MAALTVLYRGPLKSCDYGCEYCPFAKHEDGPADQTADRAALDRLVAWARTRSVTDPLSVLFIPWGEALVRAWYQEALVALTALPQIAKVAIQTNLSGPIAFADRCEPAKLGVWATWHPEWSARDRFVAKVVRLFEQGVSVSVGVVGFQKHRERIALLRRDLPAEIYLWINAVKSPWGERGEHPPEDYSPEDLAFFGAIDPLFAINTLEHASLGKACRTGKSVIAVDGEGVVRRCPFVKEPLGNLYQPGFESALEERACPRPTCGCHIGYVHLDELGLGEVFTDGILERRPSGSPTRRPTGRRG